jgi:hypothetical protein
MSNLSYITLYNNNGETTNVYSTTVNPLNNNTSSSGEWYYYYIDAPPTPESFQVYLPSVYAWHMFLVAPGGAGGANGSFNFTPFDNAYLANYIPSYGGGGGGGEAIAITIPANWNGQLSTTDVTVNFNYTNTSDNNTNTISTLSVLDNTTSSNIVFTAENGLNGENGTQTTGSQPDQQDSGFGTIVIDAGSGYGGAGGDGGNFLSNPTDLSAKSFGSAGGNGGVGTVVQQIVAEQNVPWLPFPDAKLNSNGQPVYDIDNGIYYGNAGAVGLNTGTASSNGSNGFVSGSSTEYNYAMPPVPTITEDGGDPVIATPPEGYPVPYTNGSYYSNPNWNSSTCTNPANNDTTLFNNPAPGYVTINMPDGTVANVGVAGQQNQGADPGFLLIMVNADTYSP